MDIIIGTPDYYTNRDFTFVFPASTNPRLTHQTANQRSVIRHSTKQISTAPESRGVVLYTSQSNAWHCIWYCAACMQLFGHGNTCSEVCVDINGSRSLDIFSCGLWNQESINTPCSSALSDFTWFSVLCLSCSCS